MTWANQIRILKEQLRQLAGIMGQAFINALKPMVQALNKALLAVTSFVQNVVNALGKIFGWKIETSKNVGIDTELEGAADAADDMASGVGKAEKAAKKLKGHLQKVDELNVITTQDPTSGSGGKGGGSGAGSGGGGTNDDMFKMVDVESEFKSKIDNLKGLGNYIRDSIMKELEGIKWDSVYEKARSFGTGFANFLNGLFEPKNGKYLFGTLGTTIANCINAGFNFVDAFSTKFDWKNFGKGIRQGISNFFENWDMKLSARATAKFLNGIVNFITNAVPSAKKLGKFGTKVGNAINTFFSTFDFKAAGKAVNKLAIGLLTFFTDAINAVDWRKVGKSIGEFFEGLKFKDVIKKFVNLLGAIKDAIFETLKGWKEEDSKSFNVGISIGVSILALKLAGKILSSSLLKSVISKMIASKLGGTVAAGGAVASGGSLAAGLAIGVPIVVTAKIIYDFATNKGGMKDRAKETAEQMSDSYMKKWEKWKKSIENWAKSLGKARDEADKLTNSASKLNKVSLQKFGKNGSKNMEKVATGARNVVDHLDSIKPPKDDLTNWQSKATKNLKNVKGGGESVLNSINAIKAPVTDFLEWSEKSKTNLDTAKKSANGVSTATSKVKNPTTAFEKWSSDASSNLRTVTGSAKTLKSNLVGKDGVKNPSTKFGSWSTRASSNLTNVKNAAGGTKNALDKIKAPKTSGWSSWGATVADAFKKAVKGIGDFVNKLTDLPEHTNSLPHASNSLFATGGFPRSADIFYANENGVPELIGTKGRRTAVASGTEVTGIKDAVEASADQEAALLSQAVQYLGIIARKNTTISSSDIGRSARDYAKDYYNRTGDNAFVF